MENDEVSARKCRPSTMIYLVGVWHAFSDFYSSVYKSSRRELPPHRIFGTGPKLPVFELHNSLVTASTLSDDSGFSSIYLNNTFSDPSIRH